MTAAIVAELVATPSRAFERQDPPRKGCAACGAQHGSVGEHLGCLGSTIARLRAELRTSAAELQWAAVQIGNLRASRSPAPPPAALSPPPASSKKRKRSP